MTVHCDIVVALVNLLALKYFTFMVIQFLSSVHGNTSDTKVLVDCIYGALSDFFKF